MPSTKVVNIIIPAFNEEANIATALTCLLDQTFPDFCVTVVDNFSNDSTLEIAQHFCKLDNRIQVVPYKRHLGPNQSFERALSNINASPYTLIRSANDLIGAEYLQATVEILESDSNVVLAYSHGALIDQSRQSVSFAPDECRIDTRKLNLLDSFRHVTEIYSWPFSLWGLYRTKLLETVPLYTEHYGADHIFVSEISVNGSIASTESPLDFRSYTARSPKTHYDVWKGCHPYTLRSQNVESPFCPIDIQTPFLSMLHGYHRMVSNLRLADSLKGDLQKVCGEVLFSRFGAFLNMEYNKIRELSDTMRPAKSTFLKCRLSAPVAALYSTLYENLLQESQKGST